jgi:pSer/pThr/pTyr-binding forkhead associated (FHA) protein
MGRLPSNDIVLMDPRCSSKHCVIDVIEHNPLQLNVTDLSSNGTYLNNIKIGKN